MVQAMHARLAMKHSGQSKLYAFNIIISRRYEYYVVPNTRHPHINDNDVDNDDDAQVYSDHEEAISYKSLTIPS